MNRKSPASARHPAASPAAAAPLALAAPLVPSASPTPLASAASLSSLVSLSSLPPTSQLATLRDWLHFAESLYARANLALGQIATNAHDEALYLILRTLNLPLDSDARALETRIAPAQRIALRAMLQRRVIDRTPAAYITREAFLGEHRYYVDERVLIPRSYFLEIIPNGQLDRLLSDARAADSHPLGASEKRASVVAQTASLPDRPNAIDAKAGWQPALRRFAPNAPAASAPAGSARQRPIQNRKSKIQNPPPSGRNRVRRIADVCTGSGCLAIELAHHFPNAVIDAIDISPDALEVAKINIRAHKLTRRVTLRRSDLFDSLPIPKSNAEKYDIILSNPPYEPAGICKNLPIEFQKEPRLALDGGADGLDIIRKLLRQSRDRLAPGGLVLIEVGGLRRAMERAFGNLALRWLPTADGTNCICVVQPQAAAP